MIRTRDRGKSCQVAIEVEMPSSWMEQVRAYGGCGVKSFLTYQMRIFSQPAKPPSLIDKLQVLRLILCGTTLYVVLHKYVVLCFMEKNVQSTRKNLYFLISLGIICTDSLSIINSYYRNLLSLTLLLIQTNNIEKYISSVPP